VIAVSGAERARGPAKAEDTWKAERDKRTNDIKPRIVISVVREGTAEREWVKRATGVVAAE